MISSLTLAQLGKARVYDLGLRAVRGSTTTGLKAVHGSTKTTSAAFSVTEVRAFSKRFIDTKH